MDDLRTIRNLGIIAHIDAGKTTTTERMLFYAGMTHRLGEVDAGTTVMDYLAEERARGITIIAATAAFRWLDHRLHLIDTPGHIDFTAEVERSLRVIDGAVVIFSGVEGVEAQSETVWHQADRYHRPRLAFINKLDRVGADFDRVLGEIAAKFGGKAVAVHLPVGSEAEFSSLVDLVADRLLTFAGADGEPVVAAPVPDALRAAATAARQRLIERLADLSEAVAELYLAEQPVPPELLRRELRRLTIANQLVPVFAGSAKRNLGVQPLLDGVVAYLPSPLDVGHAQGLAPKSGEPVSFPPEPQAPFSGLVFKVRANPSADLYFLRTYSGTLKTNANLYVPRLNDVVRAKRLLRIYAQHTEPLESVGPGEIVGLIGPKDIVTGDTLCERHRAVSFEKMAFPETVLAVALEPKSSKDREKLDEALKLICREDPTLALSADENTGQRILSGMGELHLEIQVHRLAEEFHLETRCGQPRVAYRETLKAPIEIRTTFQKTLGEQELYAGVTIALRPQPPSDQPFSVTDTSRSREVPKPLLQAALAALGDGLRTGGNFGYPLINVAAELRALVVQGEKTTEGAVLGAVLQALDQAIRQAGTLMLEPVMRVEILAPAAFLGDLTNDLQRRQGTVLSVHDLGALNRIAGQVPLAAMFGFSKALPKLTGGRGSFSMEPCGYQPSASTPA